MREEDLARALAEYLRRERLGNNNLKINKIEKNNLYYDNLIINKEINNIYKEYKYKEDKTISIYDETNDEIRIPPRPTYYGPTAEEMESARTRFMQDDTQVLTISSPRYLRQDAGVIITSITRNINSIAYALDTSEEVQQAAILEAKKQGYIFHADTPLFMLYNPELIRLSIDKDINTINYVPNDAMTNELASYVVELALKNNYVLSNDSPRFLRANFEIIKKTLQLDKDSGSRIIWDSLTPEQLTDIENYIVENQIDYIINSESPLNFKRNTDICIISARNDSNSVSYFDWQYFEENDQERKRIFNALIEQNYVLNYNSPKNLRSSVSICLNSVKNDINSARYFSEDIQYCLAEDLEEISIKNNLDNSIKDMFYEIRHYLIQNGFYSLEQIAKFTIPLLKDEVLLEYYLKQLGMPKDAEDEEVKLFYDRVKDFFKTTFSTRVNVSDVRKAFQMVAQKKWEDYREKIMTTIQIFLIEYVIR